MQLFLLLVAVILPGVHLAQTPSAEKPPPASAPSAEKPVPAPRAAGTTAAPAPSRLKPFVPSETISPDRIVSFPADI